MNRRSMAPACACTVERSGRCYVREELLTGVLRVALAVAAGFADFEAAAAVRVRAAFFFGVDFFAAFFAGCCFAAFLPRAACDGRSARVALASNGLRYCPV